MENLKEYRLREDLKVKLHSDVKVYKKMFFMMLDHRMRKSEEQLQEGTLTKFEDFVNELYEELGIKDDSI